MQQKSPVLAGLLPSAITALAPACGPGKAATFCSEPRPRRVQVSMKLTTYVNFAGHCAEAFHYYEKHLGGKITMLMTHGQSPQPSQVAAGWKDKVLHARISIGQTEISGADIETAQPMRSAYLTLSTETDQEAERIFSALADGGQIFMPIAETFFASRFGQLRDRFGINWMILRERPRG